MTRTLTAWLICAVAWTLIPGAATAAGLESARTALERGQWRAAESALKTHIQNDPEDLQAHRLLAELLLRRGAAKAADFELDTLVELGADPASLLPERARALLLQGQAKRVIAEIEPPGNADPVLRGRVLAQRGLALVALGELDAAAKALAEARTLAPSEADVPIGMARVASARKDPETARRELDAALELEPRSLTALELRATIELAAGDAQAAESALTAAVKHAPEAVTPRLRRAFLRLDEGNTKGAREDLTALQRQRAKSPRLPLLAGRVLLAEGRTEAAANAFEGYLAARPGDLAGLRYAATAFFELGQTARAREYAERLAAREPSPGEGQGLIAAILLAEGDLHGAAAAFADIPDATDNPVVRKAWLELAMAQGRYDEALARIERRNPERKRTADDVTALLRILAAKDDWEALHRYASRFIRKVKEGKLRRILREMPPGDVAANTSLYIESALRTGRQEEALRFVRGLTEHPPNHAWEHALLGRVLAHQGDSTGATAAYAESLRLDPADSEAALALARLRAEDGDLQGARDTLRTLAARDPSADAAVLALVDLERRAGRAEAAEAHIREALAARPDALPLRLALAADLHEGGDALSALRMLQDAPPAQTRTPELLRARGQLELDTDQPSQAVNTFERLRELDPDRASATLRLAMARAAAEQLWGVEPLLIEVLQSAPDNPLLPEALTAIHAQQPDDEARASFLSRLERDAAGLPVWHRLSAELDLKRQQPEQAIAHLRTALELSADAAAYARLFELLVIQSDTREATALARNWLWTHPDDHAARMQLAELLERQGSASEAAAEYREVLRQQPGQTTALVRLARHIVDSDPAGALDLARRAYAVAPDDWEVAETLAQALLRSGRAAEAARILGPAWRANPGNPTLAFRMAEALAESGERERARRLLLEIGPRPFPERAKADALMSALTAELGGRR